MTSMNTDRIGGNLIPEGVHNFQVTEFEERTGPAGEYWNFTCEVVNSPFAGMKCWVIVSLSPQARWKAEQWLDCFEIPESMEVDGDDFVEMYFRGKVVHEVGKDGKTRAKIEDFLPAQKVKLAKSSPTAKIVKKATVEEEDEEEDGEEVASAEEDDGISYEEEDEEEDEEEAPAPRKVKATAKPFPVSKSTSKTPAGKLPPAKSKFKRPF